MTKRAAMALMGVTVVAAGAFAWRGGADDAFQPAPVANTVPISTSVSECKACHTDPKTDAMSDFREKSKSTEFVKLTESKSWAREDPHSRAFAVLAVGVTAEKMLAWYRRAKGDATYEIKTEPNCLSCHAIDLRGTSLGSTKPFEASVDVGIGCTACHGLPKEWQSKHFEASNGRDVDWRKLSLDDKTKAGLKNLRDPVTKATLCASCHVGNPAEGKVVTHEMYVAGHPPLPPFELLTFMEDQPRHWGTPFDPDLKYFQSANSEMENKFSFKLTDGKAGYAARHYAAGVLASLKSEVTMLKAEAEKNNLGSGLEYARFDCYACHHELTPKSPRQERGYFADPGRPPVKAWVGAMAGVVSKHLGDNDFEKHWAGVKSAVAAKPYGDSKAVAAAAKGMLAWCETFETTVRTSNQFGRDDTQKLLDRLAEKIKDKDAAADPEAAMVLAWAYRSLYEPLTGKPVSWPENGTFPIRVRTPPFTDPANGRIPLTAGVIGPKRLMQMYGIDSKELAELLPKAK